MKENNKIMSQKYILILITITIKLKYFLATATLNTDVDSSEIVAAENIINCNQFTSGDEELMHTNWEILKSCLPTIAQENVDEKIAKNIWNLIKDANDGIDGIEGTTFKIMGNFVTKIPIDDLRNITMNEIDVIETFGRAEGFDSNEKLKLIAKKVKAEWKIKSPEKFSQYDLEILGNILCFFNKSDIARIHPDAYRDAAKVIGLLNNCPIEIHKELAKLAIKKNAFGSPTNWSKFDLNLIGNVINGLDSSEYASINPEILKEINPLNKNTIVDVGKNS